MPHDVATRRCLPNSLGSKHMRMPMAGRWPTVATAHRQLGSETSKAIGLAAPDMRCWEYGGAERFTT